MRKTSELLLLVLLLCACFSCKDDDEQNDFITLSSSVLRFSNESGQQSLVMTSSVTFDEVRVDNPTDWVFVEPHAANGQYLVTVPENSDPAVRTAVITLTAGNCVQEVDILQAGQPRDLELTSETGKCWDLNTQVAIGIKTKKAWTAKASGNWFRLEQTSGEGDACIRALFDRNTTAFERRGEVTVEVENGATRTYTFTQSAALPELGRVGDSLALVALYKHFNGAENWKGINWCTPGVPIYRWDGVHFNYTTNRVERLMLLKNYKCEGDRFPEEVRNLTALIQFDCVSTGYKGSLPYELLRCPLERLYFKDCPMVGRLEPWVGSFSNVFDFNIRSCKLTGGLPYEFKALPLLTILWLDRNELTGELPACWAMPRISECSVAFNKLSGYIPEAFGEWGNIMSLDLAGNADLLGKIPDGLCRLLYYGGVVIYISDTAIESCN